jgi:hypothetical protein
MTAAHGFELCIRPTEPLTNLQIPTEVKLLRSDDHIGSPDG